MAVTLYPLPTLPIPGCSFKYERISSPVFLFLVLFFSGCVSSTPKNQPARRISSPENTQLSALLRAEAQTWSGTPHVWGGTTKNGIDCSALVQNVYQDVLDISIPRTTAQQSKIGDFVQPGNVMVGDLVFYHIDRRTRHVGIYLGENEFMHASKSEGVTISSLDDSYWKKRFWMIRRILEPDPMAVEEPKPASDSTGNRVRW